MENWESCSSKLNQSDSLIFWLHSKFAKCIHNPIYCIHNSAQNYQITAGQASFKIYKFVSFCTAPGMSFSMRTTDVEFEVAFTIFAILYLGHKDVHDCPRQLKTSDQGWTVMNILKALIQNCKMLNATSNSTSVVLTENDIPRAA